MQEACGVFGCVAKGPWPSNFDVAETVVTGLMGLQHRGQESAGIVTGTGENTHDLQQHKGMGLVDHVFKDAVHLLAGNLALGHTRYSTAGSSSIVNCQPFVVETMHGKIAIAHNGELFNTKPLKEKILRSGIGLTTGSDTELITQLLCQPPLLENENGGPNWIVRIEEFMKQSQLSYSLVILHKDRLLAMRDPFGNRPLCIGEIYNVNGNNEQQNEEILGWVVSSESCSLASVGAKFHSSVKPGEIVEISSSGVRPLHVVARPQNKSAAFCIFEYVYFARPDSFFEGQMVDTVRERCGRKLAMEFPVIDADIISTVPESAAPAAVGYANQLGIPHEAVLCKNRYVGRTFIKPSSRLRKLAVAMKFGVLKDKVVGKKIVLVDDSIVRGNTMGPIVSLLKKSGALQVHIRIASPPIKHPCYMGINIPTKEELIANQMSLLEMETYLGADSVRYLSLEGLIESCKTTDAGSSDGGYCTACLNGCYPVDFDW